MIKSRQFSLNRNRSRDSLFLPEVFVATGATSARFFLAVRYGFMSLRGLFRNNRDDSNRITFFVILAVLLVSCFSSAQPQPSPAPGPGTGIEGLITVGPTHGGPARIGVPDSKPLANVTFVVENEKGATMSFATDDQGRFRILLAPGHYEVLRKDAQPKVGRYGPFEVDVVMGQMTKVEWYCDSGRR